MKIDRVLAGNPGPFTGPGTNTWIVDDLRCPIAVHHVEPGVEPPRGVLGGEPPRNEDEVLVSAGEAAFF